MAKIVIAKGILKYTLRKKRRNYQSLERVSIVVSSEASGAYSGHALEMQSTVATTHRCFFLSRIIGDRYVK